MKATLQIRQKQQLAMTPQLQQAIHLLQLSTQELEQEIGRAVAQNPFLERLDLPRTDTVGLHADGSTRAPADPAFDTAFGAASGMPGSRHDSTAGHRGDNPLHAGTGSHSAAHGSGMRDGVPSEHGRHSEYGSSNAHAGHDGRDSHAPDADFHDGSDHALGDGPGIADGTGTYDSEADYGAEGSFGDEGWGFDTPGPRPDGSDQDESFRHALASDVSLQTHLLDQLAETRCTPRQRALTELLIWELRDDGYFGPEFSLGELLATLQARAATQADPDTTPDGQTDGESPGAGAQPNARYPHHWAHHDAHDAHDTHDTHGTHDNAYAPQENRGLTFLRHAETGFTSRKSGAATAAPEHDARPDFVSSLEHDLHAAFDILQGMDPAGVGARSPGECLRLQLLRLEEGAPSVPDILPLALQLVSDDCLPLLADQKDDLLCRRLRCAPERLRAARLLIRSLDPHPGNRFGSEPAGYIIPDLIVRHTARGWRAELTATAMPRLRVHDEYESLLKNHQPAEKSAAQNPKSGAEWVQRVTEDSHDETACPTTVPAGNGLLQQLQEARSLARQVQQRGHTILQVAQAIIDRQKPFFSQGPEALRPLVLRDIAEAIGRHETTVSRATTHKYIRTPFGIFELKYFFSSQVATDSGGLTASNAIRAQIQKLIEQENPHQPLTDAELTEMLGQRGIQVARRTVAKYRESLDILPASQRRRR